MKKLLILVITILFAFTPIDNKSDRIGIAGPFKFNKTKFELKWANKPNDNYYIQEYLPADESPESFNQMLTCHLFITDLSVKEAVQLKTKELDERKKTDAICNYLVNESPDGKEFMVDFLLGESKDSKMTIAEFNVYRYKKVKINRKTNGILVFAYSKRSYGDDITAFLKGLGKERINHLTEMIAFDTPKVKMK